MSFAAIVGHGGVLTLGASAQRGGGMRTAPSRANGKKHIQSGMNCRDS